MDTKTYTAEEIAKIAPQYKGKPANFRPDKVGQGRRKATPRPTGSEEKTNKPKRAPITEMPKPSLIERNVNPTPQKNNSLLEESIFGCEVTVVPIEPRVHFSANYCAVPSLAEETYREYAKDVPMIDRKLVREELSYYYTGLLWLRLLDIKQKYGLEALNSEEKTLLKDTKEDTYNVPQPFYSYIASIGSVVDKMGKRTYVRVPSLPIAVAGGKGGYHSVTLNADSHNLFEGIPSLGVAGDMLMAIATDARNPNPTFGFAVPEGTTTSSNLLGKFGPIGPRRPEISQKLAGYGITGTAFAEYCEGTRFNRQYLRAISDMIGTWETFRIEKVNFSSLTSDGSTVQIVKSTPTDETANRGWLCREVQNTSPEEETTAIMGAAFAFRFQVQKESLQGATVLIENANWCSVTSADPAAPFVLP